MDSGRSERGLGAKGCLIILAVALLVLGVVGWRMTVGTYNGIVLQDESVEARWGDVGSQYTRRSELVPQLVSVVKGAADFEKSTMLAVTEARAQVGKMALPSSSDGAGVQQFLAAQESLGSSLSRLLVVAEKYPALRATESFLSLQDQLEGTDNRINVARMDYIAAVRDYNTAIRQFPGVIVAGMYGFEKRDQLEFDDGHREVPVIDFGEDQ